MTCSIFPIRICLIFLSLFSSQGWILAADKNFIDPSSAEILEIPELSDEEPAAGKKVKVTPAQYAGTDVFHTLYLPGNWTKNGDPLPIIFEYTGNYFPRAGSTGEPEDGALGYCLSAAKYIWVSLPYISEGGTDNAVTWWGDEAATIAYAKKYVPAIIKEFNADAKNVFLCGFSRGAIGVNYIGLHDEHIAKLWTAFISHDHFDGVKQWGRTNWGSPLQKYRHEAAVRLKRVAGRPYLVSQNGGNYGTEEFIGEVLPDAGNFTFATISAGEIFGGFPNEFVKAAHTDRWALKPGKYRTRAWQWMNDVTSGRRR